MNNDDYHYYQLRIPGKNYLSTPFPNNRFDKQQLRYFRKVFDSSGEEEFFMNLKTKTLRTTEKKRDQIEAIFFEDSRKIKRLAIQRFNAATGNAIGKVQFSFNEDEITLLLEFLLSIKHIPLYPGRTVFTDSELRNLIHSQNINDILQENQEKVIQFVQNKITNSDIIGLAYRKKQLEIFNKLLNNPDYINEARNMWDIKQSGTETVWQHFFEKNPWIFGYGLNLIFSSNLVEDRLEQIVSGADFNTAGKRVDALMKTHGAISSLCFIEIKKHDTRLLHERQYRSSTWQISNELSGSVAQIQKTVEMAMKNFSSKLDIKDKDGNPTGVHVFLYQPKSYVVIGQLSEFKTPNGINTEQFSSFELFRRNLTNPEIITFDELYARAKFIVESNENSNTKTQPIKTDAGNEDDLMSYNEDDMPF